MKKIITLLACFLLMCSLCACQDAAPVSDETKDEQAIIENATNYFNLMLEGDFETLFNDLPKGVKEKTSVDDIKADWDEEIEAVGGLPENISPAVSSYIPEKSEQIRVEFVIPCEKGDFKVFINYSANGNLYNYVIWKNHDN